MGRKQLRPSKSVKRLWRDRVRENSVVKQFGPKTSLSDNVFVHRVMIRNILGIMRNSDGGATIVSSPSSRQGSSREADHVTNIPVLVVSESRSRRPSEIPLGEPSEGEGPQNESLKKYIVLPTLNVTVKKKIDAEGGNGEDNGPANQRSDWPDASDIMRGTTSRKISVDGLGASLNDGDQLEVRSVSYLTIPNSAAPRRPSTADLVIEKLKVEKVDGGGLSIQGVSLASNCHVTLCVFGTFFLVAGLILSYISFSVATFGETDNNNEEGEAVKSPRKDDGSVSQMRKIGPSFICIGMLMLILGITFYALAKKISRDEQAHRNALSERQLSQLENSFSYAHATTSPMHTIAPAAHEQYPILSVRRNSWWVDPTPVEQPINPDAKEIAIQCPSPHGDSPGFVSPPAATSPVPSELKAELGEAHVDIACFPPTPSGNTGSNDPLILPAITGVTQGQGQGQDTSAQSLAPSQPSSASQGRSFPGPTLSDNHPGNVPFIQVTAAQPPYQPTSVPKLPRLSRHCSMRTESRPTTADSR